MSKKVLIPIADGTEEIEAVCIIDVLRRAGADVVVASAGPMQITAANGTKLVADKLLKDCAHESFDLIAVPGGSKGAEHLRDSEVLTQLLKAQKQNGKWYAAICAAPAVVLEHHGLLKGLKATAYPGYSEKLSDQSAVNQRVVVDDHCVTSRGPGTAIEFGLKLAEVLFGEEKAKTLAQHLLVR